MKLYKGTMFLRRSVTLALVSIAVLASSSVFAQTGRTTPVEVKNQVSLDATNNTVKAEQLGLWTVNVGGTPSVAQAGSWNVGIVGTPTFNVANIPTVKIDSTSNTVKIDGNANTVKVATNRHFQSLWTGPKDISGMSSLWSPYVSCAGYKEARIFLRISSGTANAQVKVFLQTNAPNGTDASLGNVDFGSPSVKITDQANFSCSPGTLAFSIPVMSDDLALYVQNGNSTPITIDGDRSWIYLVN